MNLLIGKTRWHLGMVWNGFDTAPTTQDIKDEAAHYRSQYYALRLSDLATQAGFSRQSDITHHGFLAQFTHRGKTFSLAARLASAVAEPWFGVFDLGHGQYWYIAVRDGYSIMPDGDLVGSREEVDAAHEVHSGFNDWRQVEGDLGTLEELLAKIATQEDEGVIPKTPLVPIRSLGSGLTVGSGLGLDLGSRLGIHLRLSWLTAILTLGVVSVAGGTWYWQRLQEEQRQAQQAAQVKAAQAAQLANRALAPLAFALPNLWLTSCQATIFALPLTAHAWQLTQVSCVNESALVQWKIAPGATVKERPPGVLNSDASQISDSIPLFSLQSSTSPQDIAGRSNIAGISPSNIPPPGSLEANLLALRFISQSTGLSLDLASGPEKSQGVLPGQPSQSSPLKQVTNTVVAAGSQAVNQVVGGNAEPKELKSQTFALTSKVTPFGIDFSGVPGMRITKLSTNLTDDAGYKLEGTVYGY